VVLRIAIVFALLIVLVSREDGQALDPSKQLSQFGHRSWTQQQGLPQDAVRAIAQAPDGALWVGTDEGLARFDGVEFTVYRQSDTGQPISTVTALLAARDGSIWVGMLGSVAQLKDGRFTNYTTATGLGSQSVGDLLESRDGTVWAVGGRLVTAFRGGSVINYGLEDGVPAEGLRELLETPDGHLLGAGYGEVVRFDGTRFVRLSNDPALAEAFCTSLGLGRDGVLWVGTTRGLVSIAPDGATERFDLASGLPAVPIRAVVADKDGVLWVGTPNGLARRDGDRFVHVSTPALRPGIVVWDLFEGRDGTLWVGTSSGLHRFRELEFTVYGTTEGFPSDQPSGVYQAPGGEIWIAFQDAGVMLLDGAASRRFTRATGELPSDEVHSISGARGGDVLVGTRGGLARIGAAGSTVIVPIDPLGRTTVYDAIEDADGRLWLATSHGVIRVAGSTQTRMFGGGPTLADAVVALAFDAEGALWAGSYDSGLWRYRDGAVEQFTSRNGLPTNAIRALVPDGDVLWIGTSGGGLAWRRGGVFDHLSAREGLDSNNVGQVITGDPEHLWLGTSLGLARLRRAAIFDRAFRRGDDVLYAASRGLRSSHCAPGFPVSSGGILDRDGRIWVVTANGLATLSTRSLTESDPPPAPQMLAGLVDGVPVDVGAGIELAPDVGRLELRYASVWLSTPDRVQYQYRLEGLEPDWIAAGSRRTADYNNLPPGRYRFLVRATLGDGIHSPVTAVDVVRHASWVEAGWFPFAVLAALGLIAWGLYWLRLRQVRARFAVVLEERARISRDLHDTLAQDFVGISTQLSAVATAIRQDPGVAEERLALARRMTQHGLTEARRSIMDLRMSALDGRDLASAIDHVARTITAGSTVAVTVAAEPSAGPSDQDRQQQILRIVQEALANAMKHGRPAAIDLALRSQNGATVLTVKDDGSGFDPAGVFSTGRGHFGLLGMRERARRMGGEISVTSAPGAGTTVELRVPQT
jgi:signal transduction histidine kinase/ligand-binding sensor domain-containing protein